MAAADKEATVKKVNNIILEDRRSLTVTGVSDVDSFDEGAALLYTDLGELTVRGNDLHMDKFSVETGEVSIEGDIVSLSYQDVPEKTSGRFLGKIFR